MLGIREGGVSQFSVENCLCHSAAKFRREPFCAVFQKISVAKKFVDKRKGEYQDFPSKTVCLTVPKNIVGEPFSVSLVSGIKNC